MLSSIKPCPCPAWLSLPVIGKGAGDDRDVEEPQGQISGSFLSIPFPFLPLCNPSDVVYLDGGGNAHL